MQNHPTIYLRVDQFNRGWLVNVKIIETLFQNIFEPCYMEV